MAEDFTAPRHVLLEVDDEGDLQTIHDEGTRTATSRFWGVHWNRKSRKWMAHYRDADGKQHYIGSFVEEEEAARAVNKAICDAGLEGKRRTNASTRRARWCRSPAEVGNYRATAPPSSRRTRRATRRRRRPSSGA